MFHLIFFITCVALLLISGQALTSVRYMWPKPSFNRARVCLSYFFMFSDIRYKKNADCQKITNIKKYKTYDINTEVCLACFPLFTFMLLK